MQSLLNGAKSVAAFKGVRRRLKRLLVGQAKRDLGLQSLGVPTGNEGGKHGLIAARGYTEKIDNRHVVLECVAKLSVVRGIGVLPHKGVIDGLVTLENLLMHLALVVIPNLAARLRVYRLD